MRYSSIIVPKTAKVSVSRSTNLGVADYDLDELYSPDTAFWKSKVLDLASPKYSPNKTYIFDRSRYNNHGTIVGATWVRLPSGLWGLSFDGIDDYITGAAKVDVSAGFTCLMWWKRSGDSGGVTNSDYHILISALNGYATYGNRLLVNKAGTSLLGQAHAGGLLKTDVSVIAAAPWQQVGFMWDTAKVYTIVNGVLSAGTAAVGALSAGAAVWIMGWLDANHFIANGLIGLPLVTGVMTAAQILNFYNQTRHLFGV